MRYLKIVIHVICGIFGKYRKEGRNIRRKKIPKITSVNAVVYHQSFFLSVCIDNKHTHVFFYKLRYYESSLG